MIIIWSPGNVRQQDVSSRRCPTSLYPTESHDGVAMTSSRWTESPMTSEVLLVTSVVAMSSGETGCNIYNVSN